MNIQTIRTSSFFGYVQCSAQRWPETCDAFDPYYRMQANVRQQRIKSGEVIMSPSAIFQAPQPQVAMAPTSSRMAPLEGRIMGPILRAAAFGGAAPHLSRIAGYSIAQPNLEALPSFPSMTIFGAGILLYAAIGAGLAHVFGESTKKNAFLLGLAAPAIIGNLLAAAQDVRHPQTSIIQAKPVAVFSIINEARADGQADADSVQRTIDRILDDKSFLRVGPGIRTLLLVAQSQRASAILAHVCYLSRNEVSKLKESLKSKDAPEITCLDQEFIQPKENSYTSFQVPAGAVGVMVNAKLFALDKPVTTIGIDAETGSSLSGDLLWALGGRRVERVTSVARELSK